LPCPCNWVFSKVLLDAAKRLQSSLFDNWRLKNPCEYWVSEGYMHYALASALL
jgi:hypothetical protein